MKKLIFNLNLKYALVMGLGFALDIIIYFILVNLNIPFYFSNTISYLFGSFFCVFLIRKFVFTKPRFNFLKDYLLTLMSNGSIFIFGFIVLGILILLNAGELVSKLVSNFITFIINFFIRKAFF